MLRILATIRKEAILLLRDRSGLLLLLVMPLILIHLMAKIQDVPFRDFQEVRFDMLWVDDDKKNLSTTLYKALHESGKFKLDSQNNLTTQIDNINSGKSKVLIYIPSGANQQMQQHASSLVSKLLSQLGMGTDSIQPTTSHQLQIKIYFDPTTNKTFKNAVTNAVNRIIAKSETEIILQCMMQQLGSDASIQNAIPADQMNLIQVEEVQSNTELDDLGKVANSVQHNVPAWTIFAMFFIVIPIAGAMLKERDEGSLMRVKLMPGSYYQILLGKVFFYVLVCTTQFFLMMLISRFTLPLIQLPMLHIGNHYMALFLLVVCIAFAATSFAMLVGTIFRTAQQSLTFGSISVVIMSAIGGIWVPIYILPNFMKSIAKMSPLYWSLEGVNALFLRNQGLLNILPHILVLVLFAFICLVYSSWFENKSTQA